MLLNRYATKNYYFPLLISFLVLFLINLYLLIIPLLTDIRQNILTALNILIM